MRRKSLIIICIGLILVLCAGLPSHAASKFAAKVNGEGIKNKTLEAAVNNFVENQKMMGVTIVEGDRDKLGKEILQELISAELLYQESRKADLPDMKEEIERQFENIEKGFPSKKEFKKILKDRGISTKELKEDIKKGVYIKAFLDKDFYSKISITEKEKKEEYKKSKDKLDVKEQIRASHILISVPKDATKEQKKEAKEKINVLRKRALAGEDFATLARQNSHDTASASRGGDLGYFGKGVMIKEFEDVAFKLKKDKISKVVETDYGYHIIKVLDKKPARKLKYDEVAPGIARFLANQRKAEELEKFTESLRKSAEIEIFID